MANKKAPGFILERDQKTIIDELTNEEAGIIFKAIYDYETTKEEPKLDKSLRIVFKQFKVKLDFYDEKYDTKCKTNKKNIQDYWDKMKDTNEYDGIQSNTMATNKIKEKKIKENKRKESERELSHSGEATPTLADIIFYGSEIGASEEYCERFYDTYESVGWVNANGIEIKNWKSVLRKWFKKDLKDGNTKDARKKDIDPDRVLMDENGKCYKQNYDGTRYYI